MSKAFDKVNHYALFLKLMKRGVPVCLIMLLSDWYGKVFACVKWGDCFSKLVQLSTPVCVRVVYCPQSFLVCTLMMSSVGLRLLDMDVGLMECMLAF